MDLEPGYKQTEVGVIPEDWEVKQLGEIAHINMGRTPSRRINAFWGRGYPWLSIADLKSKCVLETKEEITKLAITDMIPIPKGTLMMSFKLTIGKLAFAGHDMYSNEAICSFRNLKADAEYLYGILSQTDFALYGKQAVKGYTLNQESLNAVKIPYPPLPEQRAIAATLSDVDALLAKLDALIAKKRDIKQAAMQQLLTGKQRLPGFSGEWEVKRFGDIATPRKDRLDPRKAGAQEFCIELEHIEQGAGRLLGSASTGDQSSLKSIFQAGDVLFGKLRAYLRKYWLADREGVCSTEIWALMAHRRLVTPEFLFQLVTADQFIEAASTAYGTHMPRSDWNVVKNYEVVTPELDEQTAIAAVLSDMDAELAALEARREKTRALKQGMMQELLTGRIRLL